MERKVQVIFGVNRLRQYTSQKDVDDVQYAMFLVMVRAGNKSTQIPVYGR
jgi:hypothetical protein